MSRGRRGKKDGEKRTYWGDEDVKTIVGNPTQLARKLKTATMVREGGGEYLYLGWSKL